MIENVPASATSCRIAVTAGGTIRPTMSTMNRRPPAGEAQTLDWIAHLVRLGSAGDSGAVQQLAKRLLRHPPSDVTDEVAFRTSVADALAVGMTRGAEDRILRSTPGEAIPVDKESGLSLAGIDDRAPEAPVLSKTVQRAIDTFIAERHRASELLSRGLTPSRSLLLLGAPGTGKTMTARYIAAELHQPLLTIDLASVMSSYLGRTGQNLRVSLDYAKAAGTVLLLDEFDALAKRRDDASDIGELKRLVNVLLLELERWPPHAVVIAASNHPELLDRAIARRFDRIVEFSLPSRAERAAIVRRFTGELGDSIGQPTEEALVDVTEGWSGSDLVRLVTDAARASALQDVSLDQATRGEIEPYLRISAAGDRATRDRLARIASEEWGMSNRAIADLLGVSHPTVARALRSTVSAEALNA